MKTSTVFINDNGRFVRCTGPTYSTPEVCEWCGQEECDCMTEQPTPEEQEQEAAYYAHLESMMVNIQIVIPPTVPEFDDDDQGYCGPTCGRFGNW